MLYIFKNINNLYIMYFKYIYKICDHFIKIKRCEKCQRYENTKTQLKVMKPIIVSKPFELAGVDLIGPLPTTKNGTK